jgi:hypothetical protein
MAYLAFPGMTGCSMREDGSVVHPLEDAKMKQAVAAFPAQLNCAHEISLAADPLHCRLLLARILKDLLQ